MMVAGGWGWQTLGSSVCGSLWKPWANHEEDRQPWVDFVLGWVKGRCWDRKGLSGGTWLCQLLPLPTDHTGEQGLLASSLFTLQELWVENSRSLKKQLEMAKNF